jgi:hypothetical protein
MSFMLMIFTSANFPLVSAAATTTPPSAQPINLDNQPAGCAIKPTLTQLDDPLGIIEADQLPGLALVRPTQHHNLTTHTPSHLKGPHTAIGIAGVRMLTLSVTCGVVSLSYLMASFGTLTKKGSVDVMGS